MEGHVTLSELARRFGLKPKYLCQLIWLEEIDRSRTVLRGRVRWVSKSYVPEIRALLIRKGKLAPKSRKAVTRA